MKEEREKGSRLDRRDFARLLALGAAATIAGPAWARGRGAAPVALVGRPWPADDDDVALAVREAAQAATDFSWLSSGDTVLIKPVLNSGNPYPATTSPTGVRAMVGLLKERGAGRVLVADMSGVQHVQLKPTGLRGSSRTLMHEAGLARAALEAGAELYFPEEDGWRGFFEETPTPGDSWIGPIMMPKLLNQVDHVVLMPRCGRHLMAGATLGLKAAVGWWRYDTRLEHHRDAATFQEKIAEANAVPSLLAKQRLVLTVATKVLTTFGPDDGYAFEPETGLVIASENIVAHDMVSLAWLIENRRQTPAAEINAIKDPYTSRSIVNIGNRAVVSLLGGPKHAINAQRLDPVKLDAIWDDRVLARAFEIFGEPRLELFSPDDSVPPLLGETLAEMTASR